MYFWYIWQTHYTGISKKELTNVEIQEQTASLTYFIDCASFGVFKSKFGFNVFNIEGYIRIKKEIHLKVTRKFFKTNILFSESENVLC